MRVSRWNILLAPLLLMAGVGCGSSDGPERASVEGTITFNGETVEAGSIRFVPTEGTKGPVSGGTIEDGKFHICAERGPVVGKQLVGIIGQRFTGKKVDSFPPLKIMWDEKVRMVPEKFDRKPELVVEVKAGENTYELELTDGK